MNIAERIAKQIRDNTDLLLEEEISWEVYNECNRTLWESARKFGVFIEVNTILQVISEREMEEAIANMVKESI